MNTLKKLIFLSNNEKNKGMGILKLEKKDKNIFANLKTYQDSINGEYILGIKINNKIIKQNVNIKNNMYSFVLTDKIDLCDSIGCVLLQSSANEFIPILWGSEKNENYKSSIINSLKSNIQKIRTEQSNTISNVLIKNQNQSDTLLTDTYNPNIENLSIKNLDSQISRINTYTNHGNYKFLQNDESNMYYSEQQSIFNNYISPEDPSQISMDPEHICTNIHQEEIAVANSQAKLFESNDEEVSHIIDSELNKNDNHNFYNMIADQLNEIFDRYPKEDNLCKLIENSYWVKINGDIDNKYYVVGIIKQNNDIKYICYGVPGNYRIEPPAEMREYSQWLPTDALNPYDKGYWVMYQDADTGENIFIN